jgi:hypothetical protein
MKIIKLYLLISFFSILLSCNGKPKEQTKDVTNDSIPDGAVPFEYDFNLKRAIIMAGTLNDTILLRFFLETGTMNFIFSDSLVSDAEKNKLEKVREFSYRIENPMAVQIGQWEQISGAAISAYYCDKNFFLYDWLGHDIAILPWEFFDKKIIEISFSRQYIRELPYIKDLSDYDSVKITIEYDFLKIPVTVSVQGKKIKELLVIDTGFNGSIRFNNRIVAKYDIKSDGGVLGKGRNAAGFGNFFSFPSDTVQVGKCYVTKGMSAFSLEKNMTPSIIGTGYLQNFDLVLDLKNYVLYLKPIETNK